MPRLPPLLALCLASAAGSPAPASMPRGARPGAATLGECKATPRGAADPLSELRRADRELVSALKRRAPDWSPEAAANAARIQHLLASILDHAAIAQEALGAHWDALTPAQRSEFLALFSPLANRVLMAAAERNVTVDYDSETISGPEATVVVTPRLVTGSREALARVEYKLREQCGAWRIHDVVVDGESLVDGYRAQFDRLFRRGTFDDLLAVMRRKLGRTAPP
jgi:phospholipid transport system substrate-binding protein